MRRLKEQVLTLAPHRGGDSRDVSGEDAGCGPTLSSLQLKQLPEAQASNRTL